MRDRPVEVDEVVAVHDLARAILIEQHRAHADADAKPEIANRGVRSAR